MDIGVLKGIGNVILLDYFQIVEINIFKIVCLAFVVDVFIVYDRVRNFINQLQELSDFGVGFIETPVESGKAEVSEDLKASDKFPSALKVEAETEL